MNDPLDTAGVARAFSSHRFDEVYGRLAPDVRWTPVGQDDIVGRDAVVAACTATTRMLEQVRTEFTRFVVAGSEDVVAVDVIARYIQQSGDVAVVSSCDVYEFDAGLVRTVTSYTVELST